MRKGWSGKIVSATVATPEDMARVYHLIWGGIPRGQTGMKRGQGGDSATCFSVLPVTGV